MILTNILYRTFFIKAAQYGTAFTIEVGGVEYLVTARHLLDTSVSEFELKIFHNEAWLPLPVKVVGHAKGEIDISVLRLPTQLTHQEMVVTPSMANLALGQDVFFTGFPFKMWNDVGDLFGGRPCPFAKRGTVSSFELGTGKPQILYIDAINNEGFSGGPLFFYPMEKPNELRIAGVVSKFRVESEPVIDPNGNRTGMTVSYNTGFLVAYSINHVLELIRPPTASPP
jgi:hypothetical protein